MKKCDERGLLPFYVWLDIAGVDFLPVFYYVIGCNEVLSCEVFSLFSPFGAGGASFKENTASDKFRVERDAFHCSDGAVADYILNHMIPCCPAVEMFEIILDFHDFRKNWL